MPGARGHFFMDDLEQVLTHILDNLSQEGCLIRKGHIVHTNSSFDQVLDEEDLRKALAGSSCHPIVSARGGLYSCKSIPLDESYTLALFTQVFEGSRVLDPLTGALDRECWQKLSLRLLADAKDIYNALVFLFVDLDGFKGVNDSWGHEAGDRVLQVTVERIKYVIRQNDYCFRWGGDEFLVILTELKERIHGCLVARRLIAAISDPILLDGGASARVGASIGISGYPTDGHNLDELIRKADEAMYKAKRLGKNNYQIYSS